MSINTNDLTDHEWEIYKRGFYDCRDLIVRAIGVYEQMVEDILNSENIAEKVNEKIAKKLGE